ENPAIDPYVPFSAASNRVARGGVFYDSPTLCSSSIRQAMHPDHRSFEYGLRVVLPVDAVKKALALKSSVATAGLPSGATSGWQGWPADAPRPAIAPFDADEARAHQDAWAKYLGVPVEYTNSIGMKFRLIPPGEFMMGSTPEEIEAALTVAGEDEAWRERINSEAPQHKVVLTQPVYVGVTEVTQAQYERVMGTNPSHFSATGDGKEAVANLETGNHPVEMVSWNDASEFCAKLNQQEELKPFYFRSGETVTPLDGTGYRLPTEAEWESACRAGTTTRFWSGDADPDLVSAGWFSGNSGQRTHAAGELKANPFGLWDVHGNVWEWVQDSWDPTFYGKFAEDTSVNPSSPSSVASLRVFRGGYWSNNPSGCRSSFRHANHQTARSHYLGFRVVLPEDAVRGQLSATRTPVDSIDLISLIAPEKHSVRNGLWSIDQGVLQSPFVEQKYSVIEIPYYPPEEYDLSLLVERVTPVPEVLGIGLWVQDRYVVAVIDGWTGRASGLEVLDGRNASANETTVQRRILATNTKQAVTCQVRKSGVTVLVDGETVIDWKGDASRFSAPIPQWRIPYSRNLFMGVNSAEYHFHEVTLTPISPLRNHDVRGYVFRDPDQRAAEWALSLGGRVQYELAGHRQDVNNAGQLPDVPFHLVEMDLRGTDAEGWEYVALEGLEHLEKLTLSGRHVQTEQAVKSILKLSSLRQLDLQSNIGPDEPIRSEMVSRLREALPECLIK
ncbi:MAG: formylglycine-generating enzyme family protein, partial [Planctomycetaceae bacterium]|nr:formylglycine-generating enzyme family protein [Planctomycetaceae bacterium]